MDVECTSPSTVSMQHQVPSPIPLQQQDTSSSVQPSFHHALVPASPSQPQTLQSPLTGYGWTSQSLLAYEREKERERIKWSINIQVRTFKMFLSSRWNEPHSIEKPLKNYGVWKSLLWKETTRHRLLLWCMLLMEGRLHSHKNLTSATLLEPAYEKFVHS